MLDLMHTMNTQIQAPNQAKDLRFGFGFKLGVRAASLLGLGNVVKSEVQGLGLRVRFKG